MKRLGDEEVKAVVEVLKREPLCLSGYYKNPNGGPSNQAFEEALAAYHGLRYAVTCSNGTSALHIALLACGVKRGDEVIVPPLTFYATASAVLMVGAKPVFADVDPKTYNIDPDSVNERLTPKTKAIIPVHLLGMPVDMDRLIEVLPKNRDVIIIEDNAQALGAKYKGQLTGTFGKASILSFQETKTITTGEGGAVLTDNKKVAEKARFLRNHGAQYGLQPYLTYNYRMTEIQAAIGLVQLRKLDSFIKMQVENAKELFKVLPKEVHPPFIPNYAEPTLYIVGCTVEEGFPREKFVEALTRKGVNRLLPGATVSLGYTKTIMELPLLKKFKKPCPVAEDLVKKFIWFDCHRFRTLEEFRENELKIISETFKELGYNVPG